MRRPVFRKIVAPLLALLTCACDFSTDPEVQRLIAIQLDFCSNEIPTWFAYQNQGEPWTPITPDAAGTFSFTATNRVALAFVHQNGGDYATEVIFAANTELEKVSGAACLEESGPKAVNGTVIGVTGGQLALVGMSFSSVYLNSQQNTFSLTALADRPLDLVASRVILNGSIQQADRVVVRRTQLFTTGTNMPLIDLAGSEAVVPIQQTATLAGIQSGEGALLLNNFFTQLETSHTLTYMDSPIANGARPFVAVPATTLAAGDYHDLFLLASTADGDVRGAERFFRNPADQTLTLGAPLTTPNITQLGSATPYVRYRSQLASQPDYDAYLTVSFHEQFQFSTTDVKLTATAGFFRGTPNTWDVTIPDFTAVTGWQNAWGLKSGSIDWEVTAFSGRAELALGAKPNDGESVRFAIAMSSVSAVQAFRAGRASGPPRPRPFSRAR